MGGYNYLVSSLPALSLAAPPPFSPADFRFHCQGVLSKGDLALSIALGIVLMSIILTLNVVAYGLRCWAARRYG